MAAVPCTAALFSVLTMSDMVRNMDVSSMSNFVWELMVSRFQVMLVLCKHS